MHRVAVDCKVVPDEVEKAYLAQFSFLNKFKHKNLEDTTRQPNIRFFNLGVFANKEEVYERNNQRYRRKLDLISCKERDEVQEQGGDEELQSEAMPRLYEE